MPLLSAGWLSGYAVTNLFCDQLHRVLESRLQTELSTLDGFHQVTENVSYKLTYEVVT